MPLRGVILSVNRSVWFAIDQLEITFMPLCNVGIADNVGKYTCWSFEVCVSLSKDNKNYFE